MAREWWNWECRPENLSPVLFNHCAAQVLTYWALTLTETWVQDSQVDVYELHNVLLHINFTANLIQIPHCLSYFHNNPIG